MIKDVQALIQKCHNGEFVIQETVVHKKHLKDLLYGDGVIDENKSVKWNRDETQRLIDQYKAELNMIIHVAEATRLEFKSEIRKVVTEVYSFNRQQFEKIFNHIAARPEHSQYQTEPYSCALFVEDIIKACDWLHTFYHLA